MRRDVPIIAVLLVACTTPEQRLAERALRMGAAAYDERAYARADSLFALAPFDGRAVFNAGNSAFEQLHWSDAIQRYREAAQLDTALAMQARARFNLGAAHLAEARDADSSTTRIRRDLGDLRTGSGDIAQDVSTFVLRDSLRHELMRLEGTIDSSYAAAMKWNKAVLRIDANDDDARRNLVIAQRAHADRQRAKEARDKRDQDKNKDQALSARAQLIIQQADSLVQRYRFQPALELMQEGLREDPSLKQKEEYMKKLETVMKAATAQ